MSSADYTAVCVNKESKNNIYQCFEEKMEKKMIQDAIMNSCSESSSSYKQFSSKSKDMENKLNNILNEISSVKRGINNIKEIKNKRSINDHNTHQLGKNNLKVLKNQPKQNNERRGMNEKKVNSRSIGSCDCSCHACSSNDKSFASCQECSYSCNVQPCNLVEFDPCDGTNVNNETKQYVDCKFDILCCRINKLEDTIKCLISVIYPKKIIKC